jgi:anti-sigma B factor antagonist
MEIFEKKEGERLTLFLKGKLNTITVAELDQKFEQIKKSTARPAHLILDLSELNYISSAGLRMFITMMKWMKTEQGKFSICHISDEIRDIFNTVGLLDIFIQEERSVIFIKEKKGEKAVLTLAGLMDLKAGMTLNSQIEALEQAGFTDFILDVSGVTDNKPEFAAVLREIQHRLIKKGKITIFHSGKT